MLHFQTNAYISCSSSSRVEISFDVIGISKWLDPISMFGYYPYRGGKFLFFPLLSRKKKTFFRFPPLHPLKMQLVKTLL